MSTDRQWQVWHPARGGTRSNAASLLATTAKEAAEKYVDHCIFFAQTNPLSRLDYPAEILVLDHDGNEEVYNVSPSFSACLVRSPSLQDGFSRLYRALYGEEWTSRNAKVEQRLMEDAATLVGLAHDLEQYVSGRNMDLPPALDAFLDNLTAIRKDR